MVTHRVMRCGLCFGSTTRREKMATVRFSADLKGRIKNKAKSLFEAREKAAKKKFPNKWAERIYDLMYQDTKDQMLAMPKDYFSMSDAIAFGGFIGNNWDTDRNVDVHLEMEKERPFPATTAKGTHGIHKDSSRWGVHSLDADDPRWTEVKEEYDAYLVAYKKIVDERMAFVAGVEKVTEAYSTLAPALKAWPALWDLLPSGTQERHREIIERKKQTREERIGADVDFNKLTAQVTADKLTR